MSTDLQLKLGPLRRGIQAFPACPRTRTCVTSGCHETRRERRSISRLDHIRAAQCEQNRHSTGSDLFHGREGGGQRALVFRPREFDGPSNHCARGGEEVHPGGSPDVPECDRGGADQDQSPEEGGGSRQGGVLLISIVVVS